MAPLVMVHTHASGLCPVRSSRPTRLHARAAGQRVCAACEHGHEVGPAEHLREDARGEPHGHEHGDGGLRAEEAEQVRLLVQRRGELTKHADDEAGRTNIAVTRC